MRNRTTAILSPEKKPTFFHRPLAKTTRSRRWENEDWEKSVAVPTFNRKPLRRVKFTAQEAGEGYCIFKMTDKGSSPVDWKNLSKSHQQAFQEVIETFVGKNQSADENFTQGFSFAYSSEDVDFSAVCIALHGKVMLFYKELEQEI
jgi:hypothetical protein